jgi:hypothetical protein
MSRIMEFWSLLERLGDRDLEFLAPGRADVLRRNPDFLPVLLDSPDLLGRLLAQEAVLLHVSPYLLFLVLLRHAERDLQTSGYTVERAGPRQRLPVFDAPSVREVLADDAIRSYLVDLLTSYTRVGSGSVWRRTARGLRRWRFSELDPDSLRRLEAVATADDERFFFRRRAADAALFLAGVFPDWAGAPRLRGRSLEDLERHGVTWYRSAARDPLAERTGLAPVLQGIADRFHLARKALNFVADRYLFPFRERWFPAA